MSDSPTTGTQNETERLQVPATTACRRGPGVALLAAAVGILGGGVLLTALTSDVTKVSEPGVRLLNDRPFLVSQAGEWTGGELQGLSEAEKELLPADTEAARRTYTDKNGDEVYCSIVLAGRDVTSIHRPEYCLPGQGWRIQNEHVEAIPVAGAPGGTLHVMRMNNKRSVPLPDGRTVEYDAVVVYWFIGKDRVTPYHWQRIFWTARDRVLHNTNHRWAYVMISKAVTGSMVPTDRDQSSEEAMKVVARFVQDIYPTLLEKGGDRSAAAAGPAGFPGDQAVN
jgi:EpsI family protein